MTIRDEVGFRLAKVTICFRGGGLSLGLGGLGGGLRGGLGGGRGSGLGGKDNGMGEGGEGSAGVMDRDWAGGGLTAAENANCMLQGTLPKRPPS